MRHYSLVEAADRTGLHRRELIHYLTHFSRFFESAIDPEHRRFSPADLVLLKRIHELLSEGHSPSQVETRLLAESFETQRPGPDAPRVVLVASARARAGKSTIAYALASALATKSSGVVLVDFGTSAPRSSAMAGLASINTVTSATRPEDLRDLLEAPRSGTKWLVVDCGSGEDEVTLRMAPFADLIIVIVTEDVAANAEAMSLVRSLFEVNAAAPLALVINRVTSFQQANDILTRLNAVSVRLNSKELQSLGWLSEDDRLRTAASAGVLTRENSPALPLWNSADTIAAATLALSKPGHERRMALSATQILQTFSRSTSASDAGNNPSPGA